MTTSQQFLSAFDALPDTERNALSNELLQRQPIGDSDLPDTTLAELADELFQTYDAAETDDAADFR